MANANERVTLAVCAFVAGCLLLAPLEIRSSLAAFAISAGLFVWHWRRSKKEAPPPAPRAAALAAAPLEGAGAAPSSTHEDGGGAASSTTGGDDGSLHTSTP